MKRFTCLAMGLAISIGVLSACTKAPMPMTAPPAQVPYMAFDMADNIQADHSMAMQRIAQKLNITDEQKAQFKQIIQNYKAQLKSADRAAKKQEFKNIILAENIDTTALSNFLNARYNEMKEKTSTIVDMMADLRGVLTDEQRALVVNFLNEDLEKLSNKHHEKMEKYFLGDLTLTNEQQTALNTLKDRVKALQARKMEVMKPALAAFVQSGDKAALLEKIQSLQDEIQPPITEAVDFIASLSLEQRQAILTKLETLKSKMKHRGEAPVVTPTEEPVVATPTVEPSIAPSEEPVVVTPSEAPVVTAPSEAPVAVPTEEASAAPVAETTNTTDMGTSSPTCTGMH